MHYGFGAILFDRPPHSSTTALCDLTPRYHLNALTDVPGLVLPPLFGTVKAVVKSFIGWTEGFFVFEVDDF